MPNHRTARNLQEREQFRTLMACRGAHFHLIGMGGIGMAGLALQLFHRGFLVSGCDASGGRVLDWLATRGISSMVGQSTAHLVEGLQGVIRSAAVPDTHLEVREAVQRGIPVFFRGCVLPVLLEDRFSVAISGTHGKTTTTAMITKIFQSAGRDPSYCVGGEWFEGRGMAGVGKGQDLIVEADESDGTVALYHPDIAVLTNIEHDHMENFETESALVSCFESFCRQARKAVVYCADDARARQICSPLPNATSYGFAEDAAIQGRHLHLSAEGSRFDVLFRGEPWGSFALSVPGRHNVQNALGACAAAFAAGISADEARTGLRDFLGVRRRFECIQSPRGWSVISDYSHHPTEVRALVQTALLLKPQRLIAVFQPHRFTRTKALGADFPASFEGVDELILTPVYAASEAPLPGGTSADLLTHFHGQPAPAVMAVATLEEAWEKVKPMLNPGDVLLVVGAGDVEKIAYWAVQE